MVPRMEKLLLDVRHAYIRVGGDNDMKWFLRCSSVVWEVVHERKIDLIVV